ncbi:N-acetylglucosamine-6-phosphate deacetylase [uncultured Roseibium sp.]|uniref:N-acetylglucosamine-6-phosphate deacetylase n=1 Tax=uncultured Roseibium sp. TaxID=1936171 RepID=UPI002638301C|nr:N-acetylglucosamine-6-phosphate deacetylase [uncultured Roseibium sp.]
MTGPTAYACRRLFDGDMMHEDAALLVKDGSVAGGCAVSDVPDDFAIEDLGDGILVPGLVDLQVNGGGGLMLGDAETLDDVARICQAHVPLGTTAMTPTLITDTRETTRRIVELGMLATENAVPGFHGLHLEGPHLSVSRKGAHDAALIRPMENEDVAFYLEAVDRLPSLMMTVAPETVTPEQTAVLSKAGIHVSLGHTGAGYERCRQAANAGATCVTHLFNAMSPLQHREPGLVGAALDLGTLNAGLIADGIHVDPVAIRIALNSKTGPGRIFLVTDAMSQTGTDVASFTLGGRKIFRQNGMLTLADGTLAGADIDLPASIRFLVDHIGVDLETALAMATSIPADVIRKPIGRLNSGCVADFVLLSTPDFGVKRVWLGGRSQ